MGQILLNAELHAGPDAHVWMLLEAEDDALVVSVRDNGVGMDPEAVRQALDQGRLGIRHSIIGRVRDLGGTADVTSAPGRGVEWELRVPLDPGARARPTPHPDGECRPDRPPARRHPAWTPGHGTDLAHRHRRSPRGHPPAAA